MDADRPRRRRMPRLAALALAAACPFAGATDWPPSDEAVGNAAAAVVLAALDGTFDAELELRLDAVDLAWAAPGGSDAVVHGRGHAWQVGQPESSALPVTFRARFDPSSAAAGWPELDLGGDGADGGGTFVPNDALLVAALESLLAAGTSGQAPLDVQLGTVETIASGGRYQRILGMGRLADGAGVQVDALFDSVDGRWLAIDTADAGH
jgi:hypothetical protein